ncbi:FAD:protein FMN transferase [Candidatus Neomarinimicrobiota bacterium]
MVALLGEWNINHAVVHGGSSTVLAAEPPPGEEGWPLTISIPGTWEVMARISLAHQALSGSGLEKAQHIIDPRSGRPVEGRRAAWCLAPRAGLADALSTAFIIMQLGEIEAYCSVHTDVAALVMDMQIESDPVIHRFGDWGKTDFLIS